MSNTRRTLRDDAWVEFKPNGYPYKLQRQIREERDDQKILEIIAPYITGCAMPLADGGTLEQVSSAADFEAVEEDVIIHLIREFFAFRHERMYGPLNPNS